MRCPICKTAKMTISIEPEVRPVTGALGAKIHGLEVNTLTDDGFSLIHQSLLDHHVVFLPGQAGMTPEAHIALGERFGEVELHPYLHAGRFLYAQALEFSGQMDAALEQYRRARAMSPELLWMRAHEAACLARNGRRAEALKILEELQRVRESDYVDAYSIAILQEALGAKEEAFRELERALHENSALLFVQDVDRNMDPFRDDPRFASLRERLFANADQGVSSAA